MKKLLFIFLFALTLLTPALSLAEDVSVIKSEGIAMKMEDEAEVKKKAIENALKNAIAAALGPIVKKDAAGMNVDFIYSKVNADPRAYVLNFKIVSEGWVAENPAPATGQPTPDAEAPPGIEVFHIWIEATIDTGQLRNVIGNLVTGGQGTTVMTFNLINITDYASYRSLLASLERIPLIKEVSYNSFARGNIVLTAKVAGDVQTLSERINRETDGNFYAAANGPQSIFIKAAPRLIDFE